MIKEIMKADFLRFCHLLYWLLPWNLIKERHCAVTSYIYIDNRRHVLSIECSCGRVFYTRSTIKYVGKTKYKGENHGNNR